MEDLQDDFSGPSARSIAAELKDDIYYKLVEDFSGPQTGDFLHVLEKPCTNRFLIQVGLMREENDTPWAHVVKWLQKIFPEYGSADFQCLIERNTETALSLIGDAKELFLVSDVNFEFVGPICDTIGIGRTDLLEMSDFSDRVKLSDVTNALLLELTSFIAREKIGPIALVSWIHNFDRTFCSDGNIERANKLLRASLERFWSQYRECQSSRNRSSGLFEDFLQSPFALIRDVRDPEYRRVAAIKGHMKRKRLELSQQQSDFTAYGIKEESEPFDIAKHNISPKYKKTKRRMESQQDYSYHSPYLVDVKEENDPESFRNEPTHKSQALEFEEDPRIDTGDCVTIIDTAFLAFQKLTEMYGGKNASAKKVSMELLENQLSLMLVEDAVMCSLNEKVNAHARNLADASVENPQCVVPLLTFLHCNTHFFFDFVDAVEKQIMSFEREIISTTGDKLGRDNNPKFRSFVNFDESAITRYISMACEILCPRKETANSFRRHWLAFCIERNNPSTLPIGQSNRFINYFEAAAGLVHHYKDVALFVSDLQQLNDESNIVLDSVNDDASDEAIQTLVCVLAVVYCKVLGPFWQLLKSDAQYVLFSKYIYCLYKKLLEWSEDVSALLEPEPEANVFLQVPMQEKSFSGVFAFCRDNEDNQFGTLLKVCLQSMMKVVAAVIEEDLNEFLPGGKYCKEPSTELAEEFADCKFSHLMGEYPFSHTYSCKKIRSKKSAKTRTSTEGNAPEGPERPPTPSLQEEMTSQEIPANPSRKQNNPKPHTTSVKANLRSLDRFKKKALSKLIDQRQKIQMQDLHYRKMIVAAVGKHGGPCKSVQDVDRLLVKMEGSDQTKKREAIRCELSYQKCVVGVRDNSLNQIGFRLQDMVNKLKAVLANEKSSTSIISEPTTNVVIHVGSSATAEDTQGEPVGEPEEQIQEEPQEQLQSEPQEQTQGEPQEQTQGEPQRDPQGELQEQTQREPQEPTQVELQEQTQGEPQAKQQGEPQGEPQAKQQGKPQAKQQGEPQKEPQAKQQGEPQKEPQAKQKGEAKEKTLRRSTRRTT
ncbi:solute carrier family 52, riboflavin transporter, member 2 isoform X1 [Astyanax mexicanus]|uniref:Solute carrier family 52, riboflavin transporter, member 2 isoform X1 n=1 Tax=Astyanax mexicanus TaxID=7994 RepID=A0A8T2M708_ASTMX|nr:solute carrier family 52, riboflavin transporter, member 2 isoform X1 [Astyanax mexicanus]